MEKRKIRITEGDIRRMVTESVKRVLREGYYNNGADCREMELGMVPGLTEALSDALGIEVDGQNTILYVDVQDTTDRDFGEIPGLINYNVYNGVRGDDFKFKMTSSNYQVYPIMDVNGNNVYNELSEEDLDTIDWIIRRFSGKIEALVNRPKPTNGRSFGW